MSDPLLGPTRARCVLQAIDQALATRTRHPTLFAAQLHAKGADRNCLQLARAVEHYKQRQPASSSRVDHDDVERVDPEWEEAHARRREENSQNGKLQFGTQRRLEREDLDLLELHQLVIDRAGRISTVPAGNIEPSRGSGEGGGVPHQQRLDDDPRWIENNAVIRARLERQHELLDEAEGLGMVAATTNMLAEHKDQMIITKGEGYTASSVVALLGSDIAGSTETVRRVRRKFERSTKDGHPRLDH